MGWGGGVKIVQAGRRKVDMYFFSLFVLIRTRELDNGGGGRGGVARGV